MDVQVEEAPCFSGGVLSEIIPPPLMNLIEKLHILYEPRRQELLKARRTLSKRYDAGELPTYLPQDSDSTQGNWKVASIPRDLLCRRVEITGPVHSAKMVINMLNRNESGHRADTAMLDFEDSMRPLWGNVLMGLQNVLAAVEGNLTFDPQGNGKVYRLNKDDQALLMIRCRGLHMEETHLRVQGGPVSAGLFDLAACFYHIAKKLLKNKKTPHCYIPKCEHFLEARWWNDLLSTLESELGLDRGTLKTTFLIETLPAAFQMEEILYEVRERAVGLNVGRWDKIFSDIKTLKNHPDRIMPDRCLVTMETPWMDQYARRLVKICHARGALAIGGMAAFVPGKTAELKEEQLNKVLKDKRREVYIGHDGCWVSHPFFIGAALSAFPPTNQMGFRGTEYQQFPDLLPKGVGPKTLLGLRTNIRVAIGYLEGWNRGEGCVALENLMEDLATLEISRAQTWQWLHHQVVLDDGTAVGRDLVKTLFNQELESYLHSIPVGSPQRDAYRKAKEDAETLFLAQEWVDFMTA